jgi:UDP-glucuronate 4-epimerase
MGKSVLVTGAAGFIGSHLVDSLLRADYKVTGLDNFDPFYSRTTKLENLQSQLGAKNYTFLEADIRELQCLRSRWETGCDVIVHLAAKAGVRPSIQDPVGYQEVNVSGTQNLLELARERDVRQFVFASSSSVYGVNPRVPWREDDAVLLPISPYASTKVSAELLGHVYSHLYGIRFLALRFFTVYGPRQRPDLAIHKFARLLRDGQPVPVYGDGSTRRDYTFVADIVRGIRAAIEYEATPYEVVNLGNNRTVSLAEMVGVLEGVLGTRACLQRLPEQAGDVPQTWADISKAGRLLGYRPRTSFAEGMEQFVRWLQASGQAGHLTRPALAARAAS